MKTIERKIVSAFIVSSDQQVLFGKKDPSKGGVYPNTWHIPGGGIKDGETYEEALCREVLEETGIDIRGHDHRLVDDQGSGESLKNTSDEQDILVKMAFNVYKVVLDKPARAVHLSEKGDLVQLTWFPIVTIGEVEQTPPGVALFERIGTDWLASNI